MDTICIIMQWNAVIAQFNFALCAKMKLFAINAKIIYFNK